MNDIRPILRLAVIGYGVVAGLACSPGGTGGGPSVDGGGADVASGGTGGMMASGGAPGTGGAPTVGSGGNGSGGAMVSTGGRGTGSGGAAGAGSGGAVAGTGGAGSGGRGTGGSATGAAAVGGVAGSAAGGRAGGQAGGQGGTAPGAGPSRASVIAAMTSANNYFMAKWPDPGAPIVTDKSRPSNIWTRGVYYEGLMALHQADPQARYYDYAVLWGTKHAWGLQNGTTTLSGDDQCAGQTYIDLYNIDQKAERLRDIKAAMDNMLTSTATQPANSDWWWIDALQMAMPVFTRLGVLTGNTAYFNKMYALYAYTKNTWGTSGLYNKTDHLWWRDQDFDPPYKEPNGEDCYWSRGNGWVYAALARVLDGLPISDPHRAEYLADFVAMSEALRPIQRSDGFWNVSLHDPTNFGGKETTGTALFAYGMAWGVRKGVLADAVYRPVAVKAWNAMVADALQSNGFLGYVQGTGKQPSDGRPAAGVITATTVPNFEDYGLGCFLLAGGELAKLAGP